ncbi:hypothetical protein HDU93_000821 [Gonapodya sp. JEL0774]|nr:hypothetical protein HDU93_000821 [Gonapodya sp. JEL0774]
MRHSLSLSLSSLPPTLSLLLLCFLHQSARAQYPQNVTVSGFIRGRSSSSYSDSLFLPTPAHTPRSLLFILPLFFSPPKPNSDMPRLHPDFELAHAAGIQQGWLSQYLLSSGKALATPYQLRGNASFAAPNGNTGPYTVWPATSLTTNITNYFHGSFYFEEVRTLFQDTPYINILYPVTLTLTLANATTGTYVYDSSVADSTGRKGFFPVDVKGYGLRETDTSVDPNTPGSSYPNRNFAFTSEFRYKFFYRGGEVFSFSGDDDLWVFVNNRLTACDLGGLHAAATCSFALDNIKTTHNLTLNRAYDIYVIGAERHTTASNFKITTSILPSNTAPIAYSQTGDKAVSLLENSDPVTVTLAISDPDPWQQTFTVVVLTGPLGGTINVPVGSNITIGASGGAGSQSSMYYYGITYQPNKYFYGVDNITFQASDGTDTSNIATVQFAVQFVDQPPAPLTNMSINATIPTPVSITLNATDIDTPASQLRYYAGPDSQLGTYTVDSQSGNLTLYPELAGSGTIPWIVSDGTYNVTGYVNVTVWPAPNVPPTVFNSSFNCTVGDTVVRKLNATDPDTPDASIVFFALKSTSIGNIELDPNGTLSFYCGMEGNDTLLYRAKDVVSVSDVAYIFVRVFPAPAGGGLPLPVVIGIGAGAGVALIVGTVLGAYFLYTTVAAKKFEDLWRKEFASAQIKENPLYAATGGGERSNPLYNGR